MHARSVLILIALLAVLGGPALAAPPESKIFIYLILNKGNPAHRAFSDALLKKFNELGFSERMKKKGVSWVEANYGSVGSVASYLHINPEDIIYFGVLMADRNDRITREMFRAQIPVPVDSDEKKMRRVADNTAHKFYFELADVVDNFENQPKWRRQVALLDPRSEKAGGVKIILDGKDVTNNKALVPRAPFVRARINVPMVAFSEALWKKLGADSSGISGASGGRTSYWIKKGPRKIIFEVGSEITDYKTYVANYSGEVEKKFVNPVKTTFAYPEIQGNATFVPLRLVVKELYLPYQYEADGFTVTLTRGGASRTDAVKKSEDEE